MFYQTSIAIFVQFSFFKSVENSPFSLTKKATVRNSMETRFWVLGWFLCILTTVGNGFIAFLIRSKRQLRTKTNTFIVPLAVADFCGGMIIYKILLYVCDFLIY